MLDLIKEELTESGVEILKRAENIEGKAYLFFDEIQEVADWEKCVNSLYTLTDQTRSFCPENLLLENIVHMELLRRGYAVTVGRVGSREIDFVCRRHGEKLYVQVAYLLATEDTIKREFDVYDLIRDNYPKYVVTMDEFDMSRNGIKHKNIRDFLTAEEWN